MKTLLTLALIALLAAPGSAAQRAKRRPPSKRLGLARPADAARPAPAAQPASDARPPDRLRSPAPQGKSPGR
jgi:hypothetical protein